MNEVEMEVTLIHLDAENKKIVTELSGTDAGYALEMTNPGMVRIWGYSNEDGESHTALVPIDRVVALHYGVA